MSDELKQTINAVGVISEMSRLLYDDLIMQKFSEQQAFSIVSAYVVATLTGGRKETPPNE